MQDGADNPPVTVTDRAMTRIAEIIAQEPAGSMLRVSVLGGGCSGFQYDFAIVTEANDDDMIITRLGGAVVIDEMSLQYMPGAVIDFSDELIGASFRIANPIATANCGCGTSFSV